MSHDQPPIGDDIADTSFCKALRWRVRDPEEALFVAASHRGQAADARSRKPAMNESFHDWSIMAGLESRAAQHDQKAALCERHAADLHRAGAGS